MTTPLSLEADVISMSERRSRYIVLVWIMRDHRARTWVSSGEVVCGAIGRYLKVCSCVCEGRIGRRIS